MDRGASSRLGLQLTVFSLTRTIINTGFRMIYPFLPVLARAVDVDLMAMTRIATARSTLGILGPLMGSTADRIGRKTGMLSGLGFFLIGLFVVALWPSYSTLFLAFMLGAVGKIIFDSAMQAYLGDRVPFEQRGRAIAITEFGWSGASLIGLPIIGWLIARSGWLAPFPVLASVAVIAAFSLWRLLPVNRTQSIAPFTLRQAFRTILSNPSAVAGLAVATLISTSNETVNIIFGVWMEQAFGLKVVALGAAAAVIGIAEFGGESLVASFTDRIGKKRAIGSGIASLALTYLAFPFLGQSLPGSLLGLFLIFITFELSYVSAISLMTELTPKARATLLAGYMAAAALGRALGAVIGPALYSFGILANSLTASILAILALLFLILFVQVE